MLARNLLTRTTEYTWPVYIADMGNTKFEHELRLFKPGRSLVFYGQQDSVNDGFVLFPYQTHKRGRILKTNMHNYGTQGQLTQANFILVLILKHLSIRNNFRNQANSFSTLKKILSLLLSQLACSYFTNSRNVCKSPASGY